MKIYFLNHTKKQYVYIGEAKNDDISFVFTQFFWKTTDKITILLEDYIENYKVEYERLEYEENFIEKILLSMQYQI